MRKITFILLSCVSIGAFAQKDNVGIGTTNPDPSAALEVNSNSKGLLMPRLSLQQRNSIQNPAKGLIVYQTDMLSGFYYYDGAKWQPLASNTSEKSVAIDPNDWSFTGNAAPAGAFIGTTNAESLRFRVNNINSGIIESGGNTFFGYESGNTAGGGYSTGFGWNALKANTGQVNTAFGAGALANVSSNGNTAFGVNALRGASGVVTGATNTAFGGSALFNNTSGSNNVALGQQAMFSNTQGSYNFGLGTFALYTNTTGNNNIAIGASSLNLLSSGNNNIGIGSNTFNAMTSGSTNVAIGTDALSTNVTGSGNIAIGHNAGFSESGSNKLYIANSNTATPLVYGDFTTKYLAVGEVAAADRAAATSGGYRLLVKGGMITEKIKVAVAGSADWADYVFEPSYKLMSLEQTEEFIKTNKHLPNVPSADEIANNGIDVAKTSAKLMEKIEELTLHIIELNKKIKELESRK
jgi:hypothetical protein